MSFVCTQFHAPPRYLYELGMYDKIIVKLSQTYASAHMVQYLW